LSYTEPRRTWFRGPIRARSPLRSVLVMDTNTTKHADGALDEAFERLHATGPERLGVLSNHAPMVAEALSSRGRSGAVHHWLDLYEDKLEEFPSPVTPVTDANWREALGDISRAADWIAYFSHATTERPWRELLALWWPRLLPGLYGAATHPVIRVGHVVRVLTESGENEPRLAELAHALGYWAARHHPLAAAVGVVAPPVGARGAREFLDAVPPISDLQGSFAARLARVGHLPPWTDGVSGPDTAKARLSELVAAATHRYATHGHGNATMTVHAATAPNAVLRTLPALPRDLWVPSLHAAWTASAAVTAMYAPEEPLPYVPPGGITSEEVFELALAHGDEHVIKLTDTAIDVGDERALAAALRAIELSEPLKS
jgi:hypothetical protein